MNWVEGLRSRKSVAQRAQCSLLGNLPQFTKGSSVSFKAFSLFKGYWALWVGMSAISGYIHTVYCINPPQNPTLNVTLSFLFVWAGGDRTRPGPPFLSYIRALKQEVGGGRPNEAEIPPVGPVPCARPRTSNLCPQFGAEQMHWRTPRAPVAFLFQGLYRVWGCRRVSVPGFFSCPKQTRAPFVPRCLLKRVFRFEG